MTTDDLLEKLNWIREMKCETSTLEIKSGKDECPKKLYDTLSSFSNQDDGGVIIFGINERNNFEEVGVYDPQDIQQKISEQCLQMTPVVRPVFTVAKKGELFFVSAEIPGIDPADRPCFYKGVGRLKGSYVRTGDSDVHMTEYEIYSYEAFRRRYQDDVRIVKQASLAFLDKNLLDTYMTQIKDSKPKLAALSDEEICELVSITRGGEVTLSSVLLFCPYPQVFFPQLCVTAVVVPGTELGVTTGNGVRFSDNQRIEGNIYEILNDSLKFVIKNMTKKTVINSDTGIREDKTEYPVTAVREAILNAIVHRDYSIYTEAIPIQLIMYSDRLEIKNPGGIYGRIGVGQLGKVHPYTRNPVLATALEIMNLTENRYSGIPTIQREMKNYGLRAAQFSDDRDEFTIRLYNTPAESLLRETDGDTANGLIAFCKIPRTKQEICSYLGLSSVAYAVKRYINPLIAAGKIKMSIPDIPSSSKQKYYSI